MNEILQDIKKARIEEQEKLLKKIYKEIEELYEREKIETPDEFKYKKYSKLEKIIKRKEYKEYIKNKNEYLDKKDHIKEKYKEKFEKKEDERFLTEERIENYKEAKTLKDLGFKSDTELIDFIGNNDIELTTEEKLILIPSNRKNELIMLKAISEELSLIKYDETYSTNIYMFFVSKYKITKKIDLDKRESFNKYFSDNNFVKNNTKFIRYVMELIKNEFKDKKNFSLVNSFPFDIEELYKLYNTDIKKDEIVHDTQQSKKLIKSLAY